MLVERAKLGRTKSDFRHKRTYPRSQTLVNSSLQFSRHDFEDIANGTGVKTAAASKGTTVLFNGSSSTHPMGGPFARNYSKFWIAHLWKKYPWDSSPRTCILKRFSIR